MQAEAGTAQNAEAEMIEGLRTRIEAWRQSEGRSRAMPEDLWEEAGAAAQLLGVCRVARALGLNYEALKRRALSDESESASGRTDFIELSGLTPPAADEAVVEMQAADGRKLTVRVKGAGADLVGLVNAVWARA